MKTVHAVHVVHGFSVNGMNKIIFPSVLSLCHAHKKTHRREWMDAAQWETLEV